MKLTPSLLSNAMHCSVHIDYMPQPQCLSHAVPVGSLGSLQYYLASQYIDAKRCSLFFLTCGLELTPVSQPSSGEWWSGASSANKTALLTHLTQR